MNMTPTARSSNGTPLFQNHCPDCGKNRMSDKRRIGKPCMACANKRRATHGLAGHPLYKLLQAIRVRCNYPSATNYAYYGGRGIYVCDEWESDPQAFVDWATENGYEKGLELDRIDVNGPYSPSNCRFLDHAQNSQLRRNAQCDIEKAKQVKRAIGEGKSVKDAAVLIGVPYMVAWHISKGNTWRNA
jgi:hypothetical protein